LLAERRTPISDITKIKFCSEEVFTGHSDNAAKTSWAVSLRLGEIVNVIIAVYVRKFFQQTLSFNSQRTATERTSTYSGSVWNTHKEKRMLSVTGHLVQNTKHANPVCCISYKHPSCLWKSVYMVQYKVFSKYVPHVVNKGITQTPPKFKLKYSIKIQ
jgi:hypothetical protein